ncbi:unnamed protein product [Staurois parvus]|uniref:Uncharacterized protein n=1 Tax=Staurois parvus TaxID=386267 RepID=A0ABN9FTJ9_9NEOB|nr:unnamed protein product [Staurois parvus]
MYINGTDGSSAGQVAVYKCSPLFPACVRSREHAAPQSSARCVLRTQQNTDRCTGPLCEVPIM